MENGYGADMEWIWRNILKMKWSGVDLGYGCELGAEMEPKFGSVKTSSPDIRSGTHLMYVISTVLCISTCIHVEHFETSR